MRHTLATLAMLTLLAAGSVQAQPPGRSGPMDHMRGMREMRGNDLAALNLSDEQQGKIGKLRIDFQKKAVATKAKIAAARLDIKALMMADKPDRASIEKTIKAISDLQYQQKIDRLDHMFAVRDVLTPEQRKQWKDHMGTMRGRMRDRMRPGHGWGGPDDRDDD